MENPLSLVNVLLPPSISSSPRQPTLPAPPRSVFLIRLQEQDLRLWERAMEKEGEKGSVCVTGGAGYVASGLIMRLLQQGYSVRATARLDPEFNEDISQLKSLPNASERLQIFDADLTKPESFKPAIEGCIGVFHLAQPIDFEGKIPADMVIKIASEGTLGILKACVQSKTVKKVIYTSSLAAAYTKDMKNIKEIDENQWTDIDFCRSVDHPSTSYAISKTITEREAIKFAEEHGLDLVTLLPSVIVGPFLSPKLPEGFPVALRLILGDSEIHKLMKENHLVHIDDVAAAQIFLFECPNAKGRYICSSTEITIKELAEFLSRRYPELPLLGTINEEKPIHVSSEKLLSLGFEFKNGIEEMFDGAIQCCKKNGFL